MPSWVELRRAEIAEQIVKAERDVVDAAMHEHKHKLAFYNDLVLVRARQRRSEACGRLERLYDDRDEYAAMEVPA